LCYHGKLTNLLDSQNVRYVKNENGLKCNIGGSKCDSFIKTPWKLLEHIKMNHNLEWNKFPFNNFLIGFIPYDFRISNQTPPGSTKCMHCVSDNLVPDNELKAHWLKFCHVNNSENSISYYVLANVNYFTMICANCSIVFNRRDYLVKHVKQCHSLSLLCTVDLVNIIFNCFKILG
jgi:hypothetical protein